MKLLFGYQHSITASQTVTQLIEPTQLYQTNKRIQLSCTKYVGTLGYLHDMDFCLPQNLNFHELKKNDIWNYKPQSMNSTPAILQCFKKDMHSNLSSFLLIFVITAASFLLYMADIDS